MYPRRNKIVTKRYNKKRADSYFYKDKKSSGTLLLLIKIEN